MSLDQADNGIGPNHDGDLDHQKQRTQHMNRQAGGVDGGAESLGAAGGKDHDIDGKDPIAKGHDHGGIVGFRQIARQPILHRKRQHGGDHQRDAKMRGLHAKTPTDMWRLRPWPGRRSTVNPASASARRTWPAAV